MAGPPHARAQLARRYRVVICGYLTMAGFILAIYANWSAHMQRGLSSSTEAPTPRQRPDFGAPSLSSRSDPRPYPPSDPSLYDWSLGSSGCEWCAAHKVHLWCKGWAGKVTLCSVCV